MKQLTSLILLFLLGGCMTDGGGPSADTLTDVCAALKKPLSYSSTTNKHGRFAGANLVPDLKSRNQVGQNLHCPGY